MFSALDSFISTRLEKIRIDGESVTVYPYEEYRAKDEPAYPCITVERQGVDWKETRLDDFELIPSDTTKTITLPITQGGTEVTGPTGYTVKPYPILADVDYQLDIRAAYKANHDWILRLVLELIPNGFQGHLDGDTRHFTFVALPPFSLNELEHPLFRTSLRYTVTDVWIDSLRSFNVGPIEIIDDDLSPN